MKKIYNFTNGKLNKGSSNKFLPVYNPSTGEQTSEVISSNSEDFLTILDNAKKSFYKWSNFTPLNRSRVISKYKPEEAAVEETFVNKNAVSTLKLGQARGIALLAPAKAKLQVSEYPPNLVKKTIVGSGHATKEQIQMMVRTLLPLTNPVSPDAADALAVSICHAHHRETIARIGKQLEAAAFR